MLQHIEDAHVTDSSGNPSGGYSKAVGLEISWQDGPLAVDGVRQEPNGAFVETVIKAAINRLEFYQQSKFASPYNERAIMNLENALEVLAARTKDRESRGVEGTHAL